MTTTVDDHVQSKSLTAMRRYMSERMQGRIIIGGKRQGFQGEMPGVMEEAIITLERRQPLYLAGGFGGITADIASALSVDGGQWIPTYADAPAPDGRIEAGLARVRKIKAKEWNGLDNGLSHEENQRLAATHRPSEIAALLSLGLGRRFSGQARA